MGAVQLAAKGARIGLVLSGGGASGVGHIPVLQALDDLGLRPSAIAGTSIGALIGAIYAAGMPAEAIRAHFLHLGKRPMAQLWRSARRGGLRFNRGLLAWDAIKFADDILPSSVPADFSALEIPLCTVATDFHAHEANCFSEGPLRAAIGASIAVPGVFRPVELNQRVYIDGGIIENLPLTRLPEVDIVLAVNVFTDPPLKHTKRPGNIGAIAGSLRTMICKHVDAALAQHPPDILITPQFDHGGPANLWRVAQMLESADASRAETAAQLQRLLAA